MWNHRIYRFVKDYNEPGHENINFHNFLIGIRNICRSKDEELDYYIFQMFDLSENKNFITKEDLVCMLINLPDIGFSSCFNIYTPDKFYQNIKNSTVYSVRMQNQYRRMQKDQTNPQKEEDNNNKPNAKNNLLIAQNGTTNLATNQTITNCNLSKPKITMDNF